MTTQKQILIDIGHANGTGAREFVRSGREEHAQCQKLAALLRSRLEAQGYEVVILDYPEETNSSDLRLTAAAAGRYPHARFGLSLHMDSASTTDGHPNTKAQGAHCCYLTESGRTLAAHIAPHLCTLLPGRAETLVKRPDLYILKHTPQPWVLLECGFITNPRDIETPQAEVAEAIAKGVRDYMEGR